MLVHLANKALTDAVVYVLKPQIGETIYHASLGSG